MGSVYAALDERLERDVALKVMRDDLARDPVFVERFRKEARSAARLAHPNVVAVHDQGHDDELVFLVMELVEGETLRARLDRVGALPVGVALDTTADVLAALGVAHRAGIIHRDVKPENVLIADNVVKVADFGLARAVSSHTTTSAAGAVLGTVGYLAPEQVERGIADARSDVYAVGLVLHEMLTGRPAVEGDSAIHIAYQHVHVDVPAPSVRAPGLPSALDELLFGPTRRDPDERPRDAAVFLAHLTAVRDGLDDAQLAARARVGPPATRTPGTVSTSPTADTGRVVRPTDLIPVTSGGATRAVAPPPAKRRRGRRSGAALVALLLTLGTVWFFLVGPASARAVPQVAGRPQAEAVAALADADMRPQVLRQFSETVPAGVVISSRPEGGQEITRWSPVDLAVSQGPERHAVPPLAGRTPDEAARLLTDSRLQVGATAEAHHESVPVGRIIDSSPAAGTPLRPDATVDLTVSTGRRPVPLVDWTGRQLSDARAELEPLGITVEVGEQRFSTDVAEGGIISQRPSVTATLYRGDTVTFVVSKGPDLVDVPSVRGQTEDEARRTLTSAGFEVKVERIAGGLFGTAHSTEPGADQQAPRGSTVTLRIV